MSKVTTVLVTSDLSGDEINGNQGTVTVRIEGGKGVWVLDVTEAEARELGAKGRPQKTRGRRKAAA